MQDRNAYFRYPWGGWRIGQHLRHEHLKDEGWKLHISALTVSAQTKLAELAESYGVAQYKYWQEPKSFQWLLMPADDEWPEYSKQYGKTFVVYYSKNDDTERPIDWHQFVEEADAIVKNNGGAGMPVRGDRKIPGTASVFYRCDYNQFANYVSREGASIDARDGRVEMEERYIADPNKPDPFKNIIVGSAKDFTSDEFAMFDAVYFGGCTKVQELLTKHPYLAFLRDPGTQMTMTEIAYELGSGLIN